MRILSLGAGVQSSTIALMAKHGDLEPIDAAIFADVGAEPKAVYTWLDKLEPMLPFPVYRVSTGNLEQEMYNALDKKLKRWNAPPFFTDNGGMLWRKCTKFYKLTAIRRQTRKLWLAAGKPELFQIVGISYDEIQRMKESGVKYIKNIFPLVEKKITRQGCIKWMLEHGYPEPPKSACVFCPYHDTKTWKRMMDKEPEEFKRAEELEKKIHDNQGRISKRKLFLTRWEKPIREAILEASQSNQVDFGFLQECDGLCGL